MAAVAAALLLAASSVWISPGRTLQIVDAFNAPLDPAYIAYSYIGPRFNPVDSTTYTAKQLALRRTDLPGQIALPPTLHVHLPFPLEGAPSLYVQMIYVPRVHNASAVVNDDGRVVAEDLSSSPERWEGSMRNLSSIINQLMAWREGQKPLRERDPRSAALVRELIAAYRAEYDAFLLRYQSVARTAPEMPGHIRQSSEREQREWQAAIDANLAREPLWGVLFTRLFNDELKLFAEYDAVLR